MNKCCQELLSEITKMMTSRMKEFEENKLYAQKVAIDLMLEDVKMRFEYVMDIPH
jgi:hypothetical protein